MSDRQSLAARIWENLNPKEPSPWFLLKLWIFMVSSMFIALVIGIVT
ncbi:hypothetical protein [Roseivivax sediminis]|uniref:Uncharacterized protein n=1 Tax=Roseivivax sediminis TaxID=936889 RepID=A0A1I1W3Z2_9RHOB|nr:hypothetical protein [Roseivivax sediminis]SFD89976.1 hypothetical protein SAMN04515678_104127 [Roseivivax sediminis]